MLEALALTPRDSVLEVGTGSGYQTALLAALAMRVESIERFPSLAEKARAVLAELGCSNVRITVGDGSEGLPEFAPYNGIIVSAAAPQVPAALVEQLAEGGRLIIPVCTEEEQQLYLLRKTSGQPMISRLDGCRFVPLIGKSGFHRT
jgi:protein-L-isoaspartate(D-aspartate) O-methyltransferase